MQDLTTILLGLQVGFQMLAVYYTIRITLLKITPTLPYLLLSIALVLMAIFRFNAILHPVDIPFWQTVNMTFISIIFVASFARVYKLIKNK